MSQNSLFILNKVQKLNTQKPKKPFVWSRDCILNPGLLLLTPSTSPSSMAPSCLKANKSSPLVPTSTPTLLFPHTTSFLCWLVSWFYRSFLLSCLMLLSPSYPPPPTSSSCLSTPSLSQDFLFLPFSFPPLNIMAPQGLRHMCTSQEDQTDAKTFCLLTSQ